MSDLEAEMRRHRHLQHDKLCEVCHGWGVRYYSSTATWGGGMGGAMFTSDVCDRCWGTGSANRVGADLRKMRDQENERVNERAAELFARDLGEGLWSLRNAQRALADLVEAAGNKRKLPEGVDGYGWQAITTLLAKRLRAFADVADAERQKLLKESRT